MKSDVANMSLAAAGKKRILWADNDMPVLASIRERFAKQKPLAGKNVSACLHVTAETERQADVSTIGQTTDQFHHEYAKRVEQFVPPERLREPERLRIEEGRDVGRASI